jgi:hypothetical protein
MKYIFPLFFLIFISCGTISKTYMCGDRACLDNKEFKEYFAKNLIVEIQTKKSQKKPSIDLVKINTTKNENMKSNNTYSKKKIMSDEKIEKTRLKSEKKRLKIERKIKKNEEKKLAKLEKKKNKIEKKNISNNVKKNKILTDKVKKTNEPLNQTIQNNDLKKNDTFKSIKSEVQLPVCKEINDCDIDKIAELLIKKGRNKSFPDITSK